RRSVGMPSLQQRGRAHLLACVIRWPGRAATTSANEVVYQNETASVRDGQDLVHAVCIERGEPDLRRIVRPEVKAYIAAFGTHDEFATGKLRWQHDQQGREHARGLFGVAVADEETATIIDQQLIEH